MVRGNEQPFVVKTDAFSPGSERHDHLLGRQSDRRAGDGDELVTLGGVNNVETRPGRSRCDGQGAGDDLARSAEV